MLRVVVTPPEQMLANHARDRVASRRQDQQQQSQVMGALEAARLLDRREFVHLGRPYVVPPIPWPLAVRLLDVQERIRTMGPGAPPPEALEVFESFARLARRACRPKGLLRRLLWPTTPNPFRKATPWQVGRVLGFFSMCLVLDGDLPATAQASPARGTSSPTSPASSPASPRGRAPTASRARGAIS